MEATQERCILVLGYNSWGKGKTEKAAVRQWKSNAFTGGKREVNVVVIDAPANSEVDEDGTVLRHPDSPPSKKLKDLSVKMY
jgi:hypothetical protein